MAESMEDADLFAKKRGWDCGDFKYRKLVQAELAWAKIGVKCEWGLNTPNLYYFNGTQITRQQALARMDEFAKAQDAASKALREALKKTFEQVGK